ncbi:MAG: DUF2834 domain-containing protein [Candidatus Sericytochromatia bacterium]
MATITQSATASKSRLREWLYLDLALVGTAVPIWLFGRYILTEDFSLIHFLAQAFANGASTLLTVDLLMSSVIFWILAAREMDRLETGKGKLPLFALINLCIGLSSALPAFMWWRERRLNRENEMIRL